jgi:Flp pilus assembly protein TadD
MQEALAADPSSAMLREDAFVLSVLAGAPDAPELARSLPENPLAALLLAVQSARDGNWQAAELGFAELPHQALTDILRPLLVAWAQEAQGFADKAMDTLQPALTSGQTGAIGLLHAALIADAAHRDGLAQRLYADLSHAQKTPSLQFAKIYSSWQARSGDMQAAKATLETALRNAPDLAIAEPGLVAALAHAQAPTPLRGMAAALLDVAAATNNGHGEDVSALLVQVALVLDPRSTEGYLLASEIASGHKQWGLAASELEKIRPSDPLHPVVQLRLANLDARDGHPERSIAVLRGLASAYPDQPQPLLALGDALADQKQFPQAVDAYDQAIALVPRPDAADWIMFYARGAALERLHEWPRAEADMNRALELSPNQPYVLNFLGFSLADRNTRLPQAREMIEKALHAKPNDGAIVDSLGWVMLRQGDTKDALRLLEKAAELEPEDPSITGHLGDAYWSAGRKIEAEDQWRRALVLKPDPDEQARIEGRLKSVTK